MIELQSLDWADLFSGSLLASSHRPLCVFAGSPTLGAKRGENRALRAKGAMILAAFSYLRASPNRGLKIGCAASPCWPWLAGRKGRLSALPLDDSSFQPIASITASPVAYCDARNRRFPYCWLKLYRVAAAWPNGASARPLFKFLLKKYGWPAPSTVYRHFAEWGGHDQRR